MMAEESDPQPGSVIAIAAEAPPKRAFWSAVATALMVGAVGATVSTEIARVAVVGLPAASVDTAVSVSGPWPKAVIAAVLST